LNPTHTKILILNYAFPPNPGVGGRRWAKFCKYLHKSNIDFIVVCKKPNPKLEQSIWTKDVETFKDKIKYVDFGYPTILESNKFSFFDKIAYRIALIKVKLFSKGNYYDRSCLSETKTKELIKEIIIKEKITSLVVSIAPFGFARIVGDLKKDFQNVKFVVDYRDPWIDNETSYGLNTMNPKRQKFEKESEKFVVSNFDSIVSVSSVMTEKLKERYPQVKSDKFFTILNGFDTDDVLDVASLNKSNKLKLVFIGTFYEKAKQHIEILKIQLQKIKETDLDFYSNISIDFFGAIPFDVKGFENVITFHKAISINEISEKLSLADAGMLFLSDDINYSFSTKFCEYIAHKLPIIVFSKSGKTGEFLEFNKIGVEINEKSIDSKLISSLKELNKYKQNLITFDSSNFNVKNLTESFLKIIET
jgi:glycosyltransferase involved in cell wall biosynthesis